MADLAEVELSLLGVDNTLDLDEVGVVADVALAALLARDTALGVQTCSSAITTGAKSAVAVIRGGGSGRAGVRERSGGRGGRSLRARLRSTDEAGRDGTRTSQRGSTRTVQLAGTHESTTWLAGTGGESDEARGAGDAPARGELALESNSSRGGRNSQLDAALAGTPLSPAHSRTIAWHIFIAGTPQRLPLPAGYPRQDTRASQDRARTLCTPSSMQCYKGLLSSLAKRGLRVSREKERTSRGVSTLREGG